jgi:hypothetical protein
VIEEPLASQLYKEGAHLARAVKRGRMSSKDLIEMADTYLAKLHGNDPLAVTVDDTTDEIRCVCRDRGNLDDEDYVPIPLATLADRLGASLTS